MIFAKYNANGNDFLILHTFNKMDFSKIAKKICDRHKGIGADGFVAILPDDKYAYKWDFYNSDGSRANMCGNASACVAHYAYNNLIAANNHIFLSGSGPIETKVTNDNVEINLGEVRILEENIIENNMEFILLDSGVRHIVHFVSSIYKLPKEKNDFIKNIRYKYDANINFAFINNRKSISFITYERGIEDITLSCGTGGGAVFYVAYIRNMIDNDISLIPPNNNVMLYKIFNNQVFINTKVYKIAYIIYEI